jgi:hypothetical protein
MTPHDVSHDREPETEATVLAAERTCSCQNGSKT